MYAEITPAAQHDVSAGEFAADYEARHAHGDRRAAPRGGPRTRARRRAASTVPVRVQHAAVGHARARRYTLVDRLGRRRRARSPGRARTRSRAFPRARALTGARRCRAARRCSRATARVLAESPPEGEQRRAQHAAGRSRERRWWAQSARSPPRRRDELEAEGVPAEAEVGVSGLERALDDSPARASRAASCWRARRVLASRRAARRRTRCARRSRRPCSRRR